MTKSAGKPTEETGVALVALVAENPVVVLTDAKKFSDFYKAMRAETDAFTPDVTTATGRKAIASLAFKVTRTKTAIDDAGKRLNEEARTKINLVDAARRDIRAQLEALADEVRKPLTEWEAAEKDRVERVEAALADIKSAATISIEDTASTLEQRLAQMQAIQIEDDEFQGYADIARNLVQSARDTLFAGVARLQKEEADRAELERLREAQTKREAEELEKQAIAHAAALAAEEAKRQEEAVEQARVAMAEREENRKAAIAAATLAAETAAREAAERKADDERRARENEYQEALAAEKRRADEADAARKAEAEAVAKEQAARDAEAKRLLDEQDARDRDRAHRGKVMGAAKDAIIELGADAETAKKIVLAIVAGEVPAVTLRF